MGSQGVTRVGQIVITRLIYILVRCQCWAWIYSAKVSVAACLGPMNLNSFPRKSEMWAGLAPRQESASSDGGIVWAGPQGVSTVEQQSSPDQFRFRFGCVCGSPTQESWCPSASYTGVGPHTWQTVIVPPVLNLRPHKSPPMPPESLPSHWNPGCVCQWVSLCAGPLRGHLGFPQPSVPPDRIPTVFHSQILWGFLFQASVFLLGSLVWGWGPLLVRGEPPWLRYPFWFPTATQICGTSPFYISAPPTSLNVASSLYP